MKKILLLLAAALLLLAGGCANNAAEPKEKESSNQLTVYTTVYPLQYFTERIGGEHVNVQSIYPPGTDEHVFEPSQKDIMALAKADLFFYIGLGLEGFVQKAQQTLQKENVHFVPAADAIDPEQLGEGHDHDDEEDHSHEPHAIDPHVWISPYLSTLLAEKIKDELADELPEHAEEFEQNFNSLYDDLEMLDRDFKTMADTAANKTFFVSHAAFGYLADTYGLTQLAVSGLDSQNEPSQKQLAALMEEAKAHHIRYILFEQNVSSKLAEVIQKELQATALTLHNLSVLTAEDLTNEEDYFTLMRKNLAVLETALNN